ncbi:MAG: hypothetical protein JO210_10090 [Acidobacteriaceae bacterium]|nr:hypothetical protein [Acidobacteriaceae bacterium]
MLKSKIFLPDINVWVALASRRHVHHALAAAWIATMASEQVAFCRVSQMGLLRLLTNVHVMGPDILDQNQSWKTYEQIRKDARIRFAEESPGLEFEWKVISSRKGTAMGQLWTDAYLLAFSRVADMSLVTFDRALAAIDTARVVLLAPPKSHNFC